MSSTVIEVGVSSSLAAAHADIDALLAADLTRPGSDELLETWRELERLRNRLAAVEHRLVGETSRRGLPGEHGCRDTATFIRGLLRVHPGEAAARIKAAAAAAPRTSLLGDPLPPLFPRVAAAQAEGSISARHARIIVGAVHALPDSLQAEMGGQVETELVEHARQFDPKDLDTIAARLTTVLDHDGRLQDVAYRERHRDLRTRERPDGSGTVSIEATAELMERLLTMLDALAQPHPATAAIPHDDSGDRDSTDTGRAGTLSGCGDPLVRERDRRSAGQRRHDALLDALELLQRAEQLPTTGGVSTTVLLTMTDHAWTTGEGTATTGHGAIWPAREAIRIANSDTRTTTITVNPDGAITDWTDSRRLFTAAQRLALIARDGGCSFPGCDTPPVRCHAHHLTDHTQGGPTLTSNGTLLCGHHHRSFARQGWHGVIINGRPAWIPPPWIDPHQQPRTNHRHRIRTATGAIRTDIGALEGDLPGP